MKLQFGRIFFLFAILASVAFVLSCGGTASNTVQPVEINDTLEAAYTRLYNAVKSKDIEAISKEMSQNSLKFAGGVSQKQKTPLEQVLINGFTATTFADKLPEMRDPRIAGAYGALEVWNAKDNLWEDLPFVVESGKFRLGIGDVFDNKYVSPGKGQAARERMAANSATGGGQINGSIPAGNKMVAPKPAVNSISAPPANANSNVVHVEPEKKP